MAFQLSTKAFPVAGEIPKKFTCMGADVSPALAWTDPPQGTRSLALIMDDPDAPVGTFTHWLLYDLPATAENLPEGLAKAEEVPGGGRQGRNDFGRLGYGGPCPPPGKPHRYFFRLHALDTVLNLKPGAGRGEIERALQGHILAQAELMGTFRR
jgi:Raf kinase inhibitor-like YbhB/YbcL family protein